MTTCGRCGLQNRADLRFCADCGTRLDTPPPPPPRDTDEELAPPSDPRAQQRPRAPAFAFGPPEFERPRCHHCGTPNDPAGRFCTACGQVLLDALDSPRDARKDVVTCPRCHGSNALGTQYCQFCGARLTSERPLHPRELDEPRGPAPAGEPPARLVVIAQDGTPGMEYPLSSAQSEIGREEGAIRLPTDPYVSPRHLLISRRGGRFFVRDLESVNGVYVRLRAPEVLRHADLVLIGLEVLRFELVSDAERSLEPATERGTRVFGSPSLPRYARLCQLTVEGVSRDIYYLTRDETVIGREAGDLVFTNDPFMSRRHVSVDRDPAVGTFTLRDLGSSNGTFLAIRGERELLSGDHIRVGQHLFRLDVGRGRE